MGLFYGASVISLFELILVLFKTIWALASPSRAVYLREKAKQEVSELILTIHCYSITAKFILSPCYKGIFIFQMERKLRIEEIINEHSISDEIIGHVPETTTVCNLLVFKKSHFLINLNVERL